MTPEDTFPDLWVGDDPDELWPDDESEDDDER